MLNDITTLDRK